MKSRKYIYSSECVNLVECILFSFPDVVTCLANYHLMGRIISSSLISLFVMKATDGTILKYVFSRNDHVKILQSSIEDFV